MKKKYGIFIFFFFLILANTLVANEIKKDKKEIKKEVNFGKQFNQTTVSPDFVLIRTSPKLQDTVIVKGAEVKFSFKFGKGISSVELIGVGRASRADLKAGKWEVVVKPKKSTIYRVRYRRANGEKIEPRPYAGVLVIVVESEAEVEKTWEKLRKVLKTPKLRSDYKSQFL